MKIDGTDIAKFNAVQFRVTYDHSQMNGGSEWNSGALLPYFTPGQITFRPLSVTLNIYGASRQEIIRNRSDLLATLTDAVDLTLDKFPHRFRGILTGHKETEKVQHKWHQIDLDFTGYCYGEAKIFSSQGTGTLEVNNPGNMLSPCIVSVTPEYGSAQITVSGICRDHVNGDDLPVTIKDLVTGKTVTLDGISGLITQDGALKEVDAWALPAMLPGVNTITIDNKYMDITVKVVPLYV